MSLIDFIQDKTSQGSHDSEGSFTLDLSKATEKLAKSALPSEFHYLLKMVQVANRLNAAQIDLRIYRASTTFSFQVRNYTGPLGDPDAVARSLADPLNCDDPATRDLVSALLGTFHPTSLQIHWSIRSAKLWKGLNINHKREVRLWQRDGYQIEGLEFSLELTHKNSWKFWESASRRAETASIVRQHCTFSAGRILIDGQELKPPPSSDLNEHVRELGGGSFNAMTGGFQIGQIRVPASNISFDLAQDGEPAVAVLRPSHSSYVVRQDWLNLWAQGTRSSNTLRPDGLSSSAWMLHFRKGKKNVSMRVARKRDRYRAVLVMNIHGAGNSEGLRLKIVRHGVLLLDGQVPSTDSTFEAFRGCVLLMADDTMETDLTGLQLVKNQHYIERILAFEELLKSGLEYFTKAESLVTFV
jgi:hypothetical protein